jgi:hypothetical protein
VTSRSALDLRELQVKCPFLFLIGSSSPLWRALPNPTAHLHTAATALIRHGISPRIRERAVAAVRRGALRVPLWFAWGDQGFTVSVAGS